MHCRSVPAAALRGACASVRVPPTLSGVTEDETARAVGMTDALQRERRGGPQGGPVFS